MAYRTEIQKMMASKARKDELGHKYPRLRRTVSAANFTSAGRKGYSAIHSEQGGNLVFQISVSCFNILSLYFIIAIISMFFIDMNMVFR